MHMLLLYKISSHTINEFTLHNLFSEHIPCVITGQELMLYKEVIFVFCLLLIAIFGCLNKLVINMQVSCIISRQTFNILWHLYVLVVFMCHILQSKILEKCWLYQL